MGQTDDLKLILQKMKLFSGLTDKELAVIAPYGKKLNSDANKKIIKEGEIRPGLFVLINGEMEVLLPKDTQHNNRFSTVILSSITRGDYVGEYSLIDHQPASAAVVTKEKSLIFHISGTSFDKLVVEHQTISNKIYLNMLKELITQARSYDRELDLMF